MPFIAYDSSKFSKIFFARWSELAASGMMICLGWVWCINERLMIDSPRHAYHLMLEITDQQTWSYVLIGFGLGRLMLLIINGAWRRSPLARVIASFLSMYVWFSLTQSFADSFGTAYVMAAWALVTEFVNVIRAARDARIVDDAYHSLAEGKHGGSK